MNIINPMKIVYLLAIITLAAAVDYDPAFVQWMKKEGKNYSCGDEMAERQNIWLKNVEYINTRNSMDLPYKLAVNKFADLSWNEFIIGRLGYIHHEDISIQNAITNHKDNLAPGADNLPFYVNWTQEGVVTDVKDQMQCGSCWAFSTTGAIESAHAIKTGKLVSLSEENLLDCSWKYGNMGCLGGWPSGAMQYVIDNGGIDTEASYPLESVFFIDCIIKELCPCRFKRKNVGARISNFTRIVSGNETELTHAIAFKGPVSIAIDVTNDFQFYSSGVFVDQTCSSTELNHAVLAVGYGEVNGTDYYIIKNSWGSTWGMEGYILMARYQNNMCGVATVAIYPIV